MDLTKQTTLFYEVKITEEILRVVILLDGMINRYLDVDFNVKVDEIKDHINNADREHPEFIYKMLDHRHYLLSKSQEMHDVIESEEYKNKESLDDVLEHSSLFEESLMILQNLENSLERNEKLT
jgi:hypothetical protein